MQETIIWTYTRQEKEAFESKREFIGRWIDHPDKSCRLFIYDQKCIEFKKENNATKIVFFTNASKPQCLEDSEIDSYDLGAGVTLFHHDWRTIKGSKFIPTGIILLDYSSSDRPYYEEMLKAVRNAQTQEDLLEAACQWKDFYLANFRKAPFQRFKHQALNLFVHLNFALQHIRYLWQKKELYPLQKLLEEIKEDWKDSLPHSRSPFSELTRLWYLLGSEKLNWKQMKLKPPEDVSLPKYRGGKEISLSSWIEDNFSPSALQELEPWWKLLELSGLQKTNKGFNVNHASRIVAFVTSLENQVNNQNLEGWENFFANAIDKNIQSHISSKSKLLDFFEWYKSLNALFDQLLEGKIHEPEPSGHQL